MIRNYLKIAWRNLAKAKGYAVINISGLAIGMAGTLLILLWIQLNLVSTDFTRRRIAGRSLQGM